jgi:chlorobactene glucosyltransferase
VTVDWLQTGLLIAPWLGLGFFLAFGVREPRELGAGTVSQGTPPPRSADLAPSTADLAPSTAGVAPSTADLAPSTAGVPAPAADLPPITVIVPARNEARNIVRCLSSLASLDYPDFDIVVVDDRSEDGTGDLARSVPAGNARAIHVVEGRPLPPGWFGKPWACQTGAEAAAALDPARHARTDALFLFTDADTDHAPELLAQVVTALREDGAEALSLVGRQELGTFWERLVQPQVFVLIGIRFRTLDRVVTPERWPEAIANGQYVLVSRRRYEAIGGHAAVRGEVVEDLRLAQELTRSGARLTVRRTPALSTRMYTSLGELVNGWTKNVAVGARQSAVGWGPLAIPAIVTFLLLFWVLPAAVLVGAGAAALVGGGMGDAGGGGLAASALPGSVWVWGCVAYGCGAAIWAGAYHRFGVSPGYGVLHPLGALVVVGIAIRSRIRGSRRIEWKGRRYGEAGGGGARGEGAESRGSGAE